MLEKESEWLLPENLRKQEDRERGAVENGVLDRVGDFGSYYAYLKNINHDLIKSHAISVDEKAIEYVNHISFLLREMHNLKMEGNVIDIGCAIGTITHAISLLNRTGRTHGLDISRDSIEVAKQKHPDCIFSCQSADNLDNFDDGYFDVIHAREFYPFTRTNDIDYHLEYLRLFHSKLKPKGFVVLQMAHLERGFHNTYERITKELKSIGYSSIGREAMVPHKIYSCGGSLLSNKGIYSILLMVSRSMLKIYGKGRIGYLYILTR